MRQLLTPMLLAAMSTGGSAVVGGDLVPGDRAAVALVGERVISRAMLEDSVAEVLNQRYFHRHLAPDRRLQLEQEQLQVLVHRELNRYGGLDRGLLPPLEEAERSRAQIAARLGEDSYRQALAAAGLTPGQHAAAIADTLLAEEAYQRFVVALSKTSADDLRAAYEGNPARWRMPESLLVEHLLLRLEIDAPAQRVSEREAEAEAIVAQLREGADFAQLASAYSEDMYRIKGGNLGWVHRGRLMPVVEQAVWGAAPGVIVGPVRSTTGLHVVRVLERRPERQLSFEEVEPMLRKEVAAERLRATEDAWYDAVAKAHPVKHLAPELVQPSHPCAVVDQDAP